MKKFKNILLTILRFAPLVVCAVFMGFYLFSGKEITAEGLLKFAPEEPLYAALNIDQERYGILYAVALGYAGHEADAVPMTENVKYYRTEDGAFHVPKRQDIIL